MSTTVVNCTDEQAPKSMSYFVASYSINDTQLVLSYGKYFDRWVKSGRAWLIEERRTSLFVSTTRDCVADWTETEMYLCFVGSN